MPAAAASRALPGESESVVLVGHGVELRMNGSESARTISRVYVAASMNVIADRARKGTGTRVVDNKDVYRRIVAAINRGDAQALDELLASDIVDQNPIPDQAPGRGGFKQWMAAARTAFPDLHGTVDDLIAEGDRVAARITWRGTHHGDFVGVPPTGKGVAFSAFHLVRFSEGRAVEWWGTADLLGVLQQLGASV